MKGLTSDTLHLRVTSEAWRAAALFNMAPHVAFRVYSARSSNIARIQALSVHAHVRQIALFVRLAGRCSNFQLPSQFALDLICSFDNTHAGRFPRNSKYWASSPWLLNKPLAWVYSLHSSYLDPLRSLIDIGRMRHDWGRRSPNLVHIAFVNKRLKR